jgi:biotin-(acetyl-CoA carboxylase) ligase
LNQWVRVQTLAGIEEGLAERVNENGALILRRADDSHIELVAGEVTFIKSRGG